MNLLKSLLISILLVNISVAEDLTQHLSPRFFGSNEIQFSYSVTDGGEKALTAALILEGEHRVFLPAQCDPEGGQPSLSSAYSLALPDGTSALVITCSYELNHSGLGIKGTQYVSYVFKELAGSIVRAEALERLISGYEGTAEQEEKQYFFYRKSELSKRKLKDGKIDSVELIHKVVLDRLEDHDYGAIRAYASDEKIEITVSKPPVNKSEIPIYNDIGYALAEARDFDLALEVLLNVEDIAPERTVLMLNIADSFWGKGLQEKAKNYYAKYASKMKKCGRDKLIPSRVTARLSTAAQ